MKKLNLKLGGIKEMLSREQMKKVTGGDDGYGYGGGSWATCRDECAYNYQCASNNCNLARCSNGTFFICI